MHNPKDKRPGKKARLPAGGGAAARAYQSALQHGDIDASTGTAASPPVREPKKKAGISKKS
jgi:hypothetical protein